MQLSKFTQSQGIITSDVFWDTLNSSLLSYYNTYDVYGDDFFHSVFGLNKVHYERLKKHSSHKNSWLYDKIDLRTFQRLSLFFEFAKKIPWETQAIKKGELGSFDINAQPIPIPSTPAIYTVWVEVNRESIAPPWYKRDFELTKLPEVPFFSFMRLLYVGKTIDLSQRLPKHHRLKEFEFLESCGLSVDLVYLPENEFFKFKDLQSAELFFIENLYPVMNGEIFRFYEEVVSVY